MPFGARVDGMTEGVTAGVSPPLASRVAARRICERSPDGNRCAFYACVSFSQKIFCCTKSFLGALYKREVSAKQTEGVTLF